MAAANYVRKNCALAIERKGFAGEIEEMELPKIVYTTEDFRAGGMDMPIKVRQGMEAMEFTATAKTYNPAFFRIHGVVRGARGVQLKINEALEDLDGTVHKVEHFITGDVNEIDPGSTKPGEGGSVKLKVDVFYYKQVFDGRVLNEFDPLNMIAIVDGVDLLAALRDALT